MKYDPIIIGLILLIIFCVGGLIGDYLARNPYEQEIGAEYRYLHCKGGEDTIFFVHVDYNLREMNVELQKEPQTLIIHTTVGELQ